MPSKKKGVFRSVNVLRVLLVTYDLNNEGNKRPLIVGAIEAMGGECVQLSESSYAVLTIKSPNDIYERLKKDSLIDDDDVLHIVSLQKPFAGQGPKKTMKWLKKTL